MATNRWNTAEEVKNYLVPSNQTDQGGAVLYQEKGTNWLYTGEGHSIIVGTTGCGKSRRCVIPLLHALIHSSEPESFITIDPKGELYRSTVSEAKKKGYVIHVINLRSPMDSEKYNPLELPRVLLSGGAPVQQQMGYMELGEVGNTLFLQSQQEDPFWCNSARTLFVGTVLALIQCGKKEQVHLSNVYRMIAASRSRMGAKMLYQWMLDELPAESTASLLLQSYVHAPTETAASIQSVALEGLTPFMGCGTLQSLLSSDELHIADLDGKKPTAIYIELADESPVLDPVASVLVSQLMNWYIRLAQDRFQGVLPRRMNVILEELSSIGACIEGLDHLVAAGRSRAIRVHMVLQSLSTQLSTLYGADKAETIKANATLKIIFRTSQIKTMKEVSELCGQRTTMTPQFIATEPLIAPSQIAAMRTGQALVHCGNLKFVTQLRDYSEYITCDMEELPKREEPVVVPPVFDLEKYIKEMRRRSNAERIESAENEDNNEISPFIDSSAYERMIANIDQEIAELNAKEEAEREAHCVQETKETVEDNTVLLLAVQDKESMDTVQHAVEKNTGMSADDARSAVQQLPQAFTFDTWEKAKEAMKEISDAGGVAIFQTLGGGQQSAENENQE